MSINQEIKVNDKRAAIEGEALINKNHNAPDERADDNVGAIDKSASQDAAGSEDHSGRKYQADIDGPQQDSQETDEIYADPRQSAGLPPAGKNVGDLTAYDLGRKDDH